MRTSFLLIVLTLLYVANLFVVARYRPWRSPAADLVDDGLVLAGALHMHTRYSDGSGDTESLARAASNAGLDFIVITDHNTHAGYEEAGYYGDVLVLVGEERTTDAGHMLLIGARVDAGRDPETVAARAVRGGGIAAIAHPYGRRKWEGRVPEAVAAYEVVNADNEWRDESPWALLSSLAALPVLRDAPWNRMIARDDRAWATFDSLSLLRPMVPLASVDAHAAIEIGFGKLLPFPGYESLFRGIRTHVSLESPLTGSFETDRDLLLTALRDGRVHLAYDGLGETTGFRFTATPDGLGLMLSAPRAKEVTTRLYRDGVLWREIEGSWRGAAPPGLYRAEIFQQRARLIPWIYSGLVRIGPQGVGRN